MGLCAKLMTLAPKARAALLSAGADAASGFDVTTIMADSVKKVSSNKRGQWHRMPSACPTCGNLNRRVIFRIRLARFFCRRICLVVGALTTLIFGFRQKPRYSVTRKIITAAISKM